MIGLCNSDYKYSRDFVAGIVWHEGSHPFVNPVINDYQTNFNESRLLFEPLRKQLKWADNCQDWLCSVKETVVRAVVARLVYKSFGEEAAQKELSRQTDFYGFAYTDEVFELLKDYEADRQKYKSFKDFAPVIISKFNSILNAKHIWQPNDFALYKLKPYVFVLPTNESDKKSQEELWTAVRQSISKIPMIADNFIIVSDKDALKLDPNYTFFIYGTPQGNLFLQYYLPDLPFKMTDKELLIGEKKYTDPTLTTFIQIPNPKNPSFPITVFSAFETKYVTTGFWIDRSENYSLWNADKSFKESGKIPYKRN